MSWEWSHTAEAYGNAYENLHALPRAELNVIYAEILATRQKTRYMGNPEFRQNRYPKCLAYAESMLADDTIADAIWEFAERYRTCTNGGHMAYVCPYGCHRVSFGGNDNE